MRFQFSLRSLLLASITIPAVVSTCLNRDPFVKICRAVDDSDHEHCNVSQIVFAKDERVVASGRFGRVVVWKRRGGSSADYEVERSLIRNYDLPPSDHPLTAFDGRKILYKIESGYTELNFETNTDLPWSAEGVDKNSPIELRPLHKGHFLEWRYYDGSSEREKVILHVENGRTIKIPHRFSRLPKYSADGAILAGTKRICLGPNPLDCCFYAEELYVFNADTGVELLKFSEVFITPQVLDFSISHDGGILALHYDDHISLYSTKDARLLFEFKLNGERDFSFTPDNDVFTTVSSGQLNFRSKFDGSLIYTVKSGSNSILATAMTPDGEKLGITVTGDSSMTVNIWQRRLPFGWIAIFYMPEFWIALVLAPLLVWSLFADRKVILLRE